MCVSEEKTNLLLKREGKRSLIDLLINNIFSKLILSLNFKTEVFLNTGARKFIVNVIKVIAINVNPIVTKIIYKKTDEWNIE